MSDPTQRDGQEGVVAQSGAEARTPVATGGRAPSPVAGVSHPADGAAPPPPQRWWSRYPDLIAERGQEVVSFGVAATLVVLAGGILIGAIVDFFSLSRQDGLEYAATDFLDRVLLVLILVEIVHTVLLSLRAHELSAQPFIVVGLVAVVRKILFALGSQQKLDTSTLGVYIGMVAVFVAALIAMEAFGRQRRRGRDGDGDGDGEIRSH